MTHTVNALGPLVAIFTAPGTDRQPRDAYRHFNVTRRDGSYLVPVRVDLHSLGGGRTVYVVDADGGVGRVAHLVAMDHGAGGGVTTPLGGVPGWALEIAMAVHRFRYELTLAEEASA